MTRLCEKVVPAASVIPLKSSLSFKVGMIKGKRALCFWFFVKPTILLFIVVREIGTRKGI